MKNLRLTWDISEIDRYHTVRKRVTSFTTLNKNDLDDLPGSIDSPQISLHTKLHKNH